MPESFDGSVTSGGPGIADQGQGNNVGADSISGNLGMASSPVFASSNAQQLAYGASTVVFSGTLALTGGDVFAASIAALTVANLPVTVPYLNAMAAQIGQIMAQSLTTSASVFDNNQGFVPSFSAGIQ